MSSSEWTVKQLGDLVTFQRGHDLVKSKFRPGPYPIAGSNGIIGHHNEFTTHGPSITIGRSGNLGTPYFYKNNFWAHNTTLYVKYFNQSDPKFIYYLLKTIDFTQFNSGSAVPSLNRNYIHPIEIFSPDSTATQKRIADILSAFDDKIELNRQTNATLEAIAQAIFKAWFVDFRYPGATGERVESELGLIPAGWRVGEFAEMMLLQRGFDLPKKTRVAGDYLVIAASGPSTTHNEFKVKGPGVTTGRSGVLGNVFYSHADFWPLNTSLWVKEFKQSSPIFAFYFLQTLDLSGLNGGSAVPTLNRNHVHALSVLIPPMHLIETFEELILPLLATQKANNDESFLLEKTRDILLPKLMRGEIEV